MRTFLPYAVAASEPGSSQLDHPSGREADRCECGMGCAASRRKQTLMAAPCFDKACRLRGDRFARHWHDVARLDEAGFAASAFADRDLAKAVAGHKTMFFAEKAADRRPVDYAAAVNGALRLVPAGDGLKALEEDYARMVDDGLLLQDAEPFEALMARCADIATRANNAAA